MPRDASPFRTSAPAARQRRGVDRPRLRRRIGQVQTGEVAGHLLQVVVGQVLDQVRHQRVVAPTVAKVEQLVVEVAAPACRRCAGSSRRWRRGLPCRGSRCRRRPLRDRVFEPAVRRKRRRAASSVAEATSNADNEGRSEYAPSAATVRAAAWRPACRPQSMSGGALDMTGDHACRAGAAEPNDRDRVRDARACVRRSRGRSHEGIGVRCRRFHRRHLVKALSMRNSLARRGEAASRSPNWCLPIRGRCRRLPSRRHRDPYRAG